MKPIISTLTFAIAVSTATIAAAQDVCMPKGEMRAALIDWYAERPMGEPTDQNEQLWVSDRTGTWTMIKTRADGTACVTAQGEDWLGGPNHDRLLAALQD